MPEKTDEDLFVVLARQRSQSAHPAGRFRQLEQHGAEGHRDDLAEVQHGDVVESLIQFRFTNARASLPQVDSSAYGEFLIFSS